ncbi:hypothetical protein WJX73_005926 [Symbiochloris irregularis]|uniref:Protein kinase domain-containing protein n=1 Tax=Symbiochloris irregularis TaxID=706552 RepID=A0AAW1NX97_9CHLO
MASIGAERQAATACDNAVMLLGDDGYVSSIKMPAEVKLEAQFGLDPTEDLVAALKDPATRESYASSVMQLLSYMLKEGTQYGLLITNRILVAFKRHGGQGAERLKGLGVFQMPLDGTDPTAAQLSFALACKAVAQPRMDHQQVEITPANKEWICSVTMADTAQGESTLSQSKPTPGKKRRQASEQTRRYVRKRLMAELGGEAHSADGLTAENDSLLPMQPCNPLLQWFIALPDRQEVMALEQLERSGCELAVSLATHGSFLSGTEGFVATRVEGQTFASWQDIHAHAAAALAALAAVHDAGVLHGDLRPDAFVISGDKNNTLKIMDFDRAALRPSADELAAEAAALRSHLGT